ncbi:hypothetical protein N9P30_02275 [Alphaproteobacteria bacterium]|nr:hypothetical protein [Alphaproteobacteria bacterium]
MCEQERLLKWKASLKAGDTQEEHLSQAIASTDKLVAKLKNGALRADQLARFAEQYKDGDAIPYDIEHLLIDKKNDDGSNLLITQNNAPDKITRIDILKSVQKRIKNTPSYLGNPPSVHFLEKSWAEYRKFSQLATF